MDLRSDRCDLIELIELDHLMIMNIWIHFVLWTHERQFKDQKLSRATKQTLKASQLQLHAVEVNILSSLRKDKHG